MEPNFLPQELRVLGCLLEKERTTPEQYPLSLNSLRLACNQKSSRDPVVDYEEDEVVRALESLRDRHLVFYVRQSGARVTKYRHDVTATLNLTASETTLLALLLLRGPQTVGELRSRSERMHPFASLEAIEQTLESMIEYEDGPLARVQPRRHGQKEKRYEHALMPVSDLPEEESAAPIAPGKSTAANDELRTEVEALKERIAELENRFADFQKQFE